MNFDQNLFEARIFHGLKSLLDKGDTLPPRYLEFAVCGAFGLKHVGDGNFYADGVDSICQASVKTRMLNPNILKTKFGRDFKTHPEKFLGPRQNKKQGKWWAGVEFVQRRQKVDNEPGSTARRIGLLTLRGFRQNIAESKKKFRVNKTYEVLLIHGYNWQCNRYMVNVYWQELLLPKTKSIVWKKETGGVDGYVEVGSTSQIVMHRVKDGAPREATCFKEYKDPTKYKHSVSISVPIPEQWPFDQQAILAELQHLKESSYDPSILFSE
jgi:hypothetical protein